MGAQHILSVRSHLLPRDWWGVSRCHALSECELMDTLHAAGIWFGPRSMLEDDPSFRQVIPYVIMATATPLDPAARFLSYKRTPKGGESRLHDLYSIGVGGHIDLDDAVVRKDTGILLRPTLEYAALREVEEELGQRVVPIHQAWLGVICDNDNDVGRVHLGAVWFWLLRDSYQPPQATEDALTEVQLLSAQELGGVALEPWSRLALAWLMTLGLS